MKIIKTERLQFKPFSESDIDLIEKIYTNEKVMKYAYEDMYNHEKCMHYLSEIVKNNGMSKDERIAYEFAIFYEDKYIGIADIIIYLKNQDGGFAEIGYFLLPEFWGKGFATESAKMLIDFGLDELNLHKIIASCHGENSGSWKVMEKSGMSKEGVFKKHRYKHGKWADEIKFAIVR